MAEIIDVIEGDGQYAVSYIAVNEDLEIVITQREMIAQVKETCTTKTKMTDGESAVYVIHEDPEGNPIWREEIGEFISNNRDILIQEIIQKRNGH